MDKNEIANFDYIFDNMVDAVCITNKLGFVQYMNNSAKKLFNFTSEIKPLTISEISTSTEFPFCNTSVRMPFA